VHVTPDTTAAGGYALLTFRVPTESVTASTTSVKITLPTSQPFTSVSVEPVPGWSASVSRTRLPAPVTVDGTTITQAPSSVTWTAQSAAGIAPGQFQQFLLSVGQLPAAGTTVVLPATQTYSDSTVVEWDQLTAVGAAEPEHPAPALTTTAGSSAAGSGMAAGGSTSGAGATTRSTDGTSRTWGVTGAVLGLLGTFLGGAALATAVSRGRRPSVAQV